MKLPKNIKQSIDVLTADPKVKAACEIESFIKKLDDDYRAALALRDALPSLREAVNTYLDGPWLKDWRWRPRNAEGEAAPEIPADWFVRVTGLTCEKEHIKVWLSVSTKPISLPKGMHKPWRFSVRCNREEKRKVRLVSLAKMVVRLYNWPTNEWLQPRIDVSNPVAYVERTLELKVPYTAEHKGLIAREVEVKKAVDEANKVRDEFRRLLPSPVRDILTTLSRNNSDFMRFGGFPPWLFGR